MSSLTSNNFEFRADTQVKSQLDRGLDLTPDDIAFCNNTSWLAIVLAVPVAALLVAGIAQFIVNIARIFLA